MDDDQCNHNFYVSCRVFGLLHAPDLDHGYKSVPVVLKNSTDQLQENILQKLHNYILPKITRDCRLQTASNGYVPFED